MVDTTDGSHAVSLIGLNLYLNCVIYFVIKVILALSLHLWVPVGIGAWRFIEVRSSLKTTGPSLVLSALYSDLLGLNDSLLKIFLNHILSGLGLSLL